MTYFFVLMLPMATTASKFDDKLCFNAQETVEIFEMIENYVTYRNFKEIAIYDLMGIVKSSFVCLFLKNIGIQIFYSLDCPETQVTLIKLIKILSRNSVAVQVTGSINLTKCHHSIGVVVIITMKSHSGQYLESLKAQVRE